MADLFQSADSVVVPFSGDEGDLFNNADTIAEQEKRLRESLKHGAKYNPNAAAKDQANANKLGLDMETVERNSAEVNQVATEQDIYDKIRDSETAKQFFSNPERAAVAHEDVEPLINLDGAIDEILSVAEGIATDGLFGWVKHSPVASSAVEGAHSQVYGMSSGLYRYPEMVGRGLDFIEKYLPEIPGVKQINEFLGLGEGGAIRETAEDLGYGFEGTFAEKVQEGVEIGGKTYGPSQSAERISERRAQMFGQVDEYNQQAEVAFDELLEGDFEKFGELMTDPKAVASFIGQAAPSLAMMLATGGSMKAIAILEGMEVGSDAAEFEKRTGMKVDPAHFMAALSQAMALNTILEKAGLERILGSRGVLGALGAGLGEMTTEGLQAFNTNLAIWLQYDREKKWSEGVLPGMIGGLGAGLGGGGVSSAIGSATAPGSDYNTDLSNANKALVAKDQLDRLVALSAEAGFRTTAPDQFKYFLNEKLGAENAVYMDPEDAQTFFQSHPEVMAALPEDLSTGITEALANESPVGIPIPDYLTHFTDFHAEIADMLRNDIDGMSAREAQIWVDQDQERWLEDADRIMGQYDAESEFAESAARVQTDIEAQLVQAGRDPQNAKKDAAFLKAASITIANKETKAGRPTTPEQVMQRLPLRVGGTLVAGEGLTQAANQSGMVVAAKTRTGEVLIGQQGQVHAQLSMDNPSVQFRFEDFGFADEEGNFYTREEALELIKQRVPGIEETMDDAELEAGVLDAGDLPEVRDVYRQAPLPDDLLTAIGEQTVPPLESDVPVLPIGRVEREIIAARMKAKDGNLTGPILSKIFGAPKPRKGKEGVDSNVRPTPWKSLKKMLDWAIAEDHAGDWYKDFGNGFKDLVGEANMQEASILFGITSQQNAAETNFADTLHIMTVARQHNPITDEAGFRQALREQPRPDGQRIKITGSQIDRIVEAYQSGTYSGGLKVSTYMQLVKSRALNQFNPYSVQDVHMARVFGYRFRDYDKKSGNIVDAAKMPSSAAIRYGQFMTSTLAQEYNLRPDQVQAYLWFYAKSNLSPKKEGGGARKVGDGTFESASKYAAPEIEAIEKMVASGAFDKDNALTQALETGEDPHFVSPVKKDRYTNVELNNELLDLARNRAGRAVVSANPGNARGYGFPAGTDLQTLIDYGNEVMDAITDDTGQINFLKQAGIVHEVRQIMGTWDRIEPSFEIILPGETMQTADMVANLLGDSFLQDAAITTKPEWEGQNYAIAVKKPDGSEFTQDEIKEIYSKVNPEQDPGGLNLSTSADGTSIKFLDPVFFEKFDDYSASDLESFSDKVVESMGETEYSYTPFTQSGDYHDFTERGQEGLQQTWDENGLAGRPDLQRGAIDSLYQPVWEVYQRYVNQLGYTPENQASPFEDLREESVALFQSAAPAVSSKASDIISTSTESIAQTGTLSHIGTNIPANEYGWGVVGRSIRDLFRQETDTQNRGQIQFQDGGALITLLENADLSTFQHELGHYFFELYSVYANDNAEIRADMDVLLGFIADETGTRYTLEEWQNLPLETRRAGHELVAKSWERYLFEGESPSLEMQSLFNTLKSWMLQVYKTLRGMNAPLTDEVRQVFDRMLATEEQIAAKQVANNYKATFETAEEAGMSEKQWQDYQNLNERQRAEATGELAKRSLADMKWLSNAKSRVLRDLQAEAKDKRAAMKKDVTRDLKSSPVYHAINFVQTGEYVDPEGNPQKAEFHKLDRAEFQEAYPNYYLPRGWTQADGVLADDLAEMLGWKSGDEMVQAMLSAAPLKEQIERTTDQRMLEEYGDLTNPIAMDRAAEEAVHNQAHTRFLHTELKHLAKQTSVGPVLHRAAKIYAEQAVDRMKVRNIKPNQYSQAEKRAARLSERALRTGDRQAAAEHKRAQVLQNHFWRAANNGQKEVEKFLRHFKKFDKPGVRKNLDIDYLEQIDALLEKYDFRKRSLKAIDKDKSLAQWVKDQEAMGFSPVIDERQLSDTQRQNYKDTPLEELRGLYDTVKNIEHLGRLKKKLIRAREQQDLQMAVDEMTASIYEYSTGKNKVKFENNAWGDRTKEVLDDAFAMHRKFSSYARQMDGGKSGPMWEYFIRPMNEAGDFEAEARAKATEELHEIFEPLMNKNLRKKMHIPEIDSSLSLEGRIVVALNWGNDANRQRIRDGYGWTNEQVQAIVDTLTKDEMDFVQSVWDYIDTYWDDISAKERRVSGVVPEKVQRAPFETRHGEYEGGYYPIMYDPRKSGKASGQEAADLLEQAKLGKVARATTRRGHTKARVEEVKRPVRLDIGGVFRHVDQVIHDLAWHEWLIDSNRLINNSKLDSAIRTSYGPQVVKSIKKTMEDIAVGEMGAQNGFEAAINHLRTGATIAGLGWSVWTSFLQPIGLTQSMVRVGPQWVGKGLAEWIGDATKMENTAKKIYDKSTFMRMRGKTMMREINEIQNKVTSGSKMPGVQASFFYLIQKLQLVADIPTWLGQYEKSIYQGADERTAILQADQAVLDSQSGGQIKDLAQIQRGTPMMKMWTNFYSYFNMTWNLTTESFAQNVRAPKGALGVGKFAVDFLLLYSLPATLSALMREALRGDCDDEECVMQAVVEENLSYMAGVLVGVREMSSFLGGFYGYSGPAGARFFSELSKLGQQVAQGEVDKAALKAANQTAGVLFHYPAAQVQRTVEGLVALAEGDVEGPALVTAPLFGPPR